MSGNRQAVLMAMSVGLLCLGIGGILYYDHKRKCENPETQYEEHQCEEKLVGVYMAFAAGAIISLGSAVVGIFYGGCQEDSPYVPSSGWLPEHGNLSAMDARFVSSEV